ncbi:heavy metal-associated isoprenylated plant protein 35-like [Impatiens glandulifera]|uniref:heavy metal-associated isoprenylated plant protein 35-like n=1 Tax=Impatiens glandulifera TaxID=253017 RepID=UPI001FB0907F|nr:heavy metal-associated isoprenylated plant protein 35-like [Impatiens glandulifera]
MATTNIEESSSGQMKLKTWVLKVSIHCKGCQKKVIKLLTGVEGVHKLDVDLKHQSVIVTGNVDANTLINKLIKSGRNAELWYQISNQKNKQNNSGKDKSTDDLPTAQCEIVAGDDKQKEKPALEKSDASQDSGSENPATAERSEVAGDTTTDSAGKVKAVKEDKLVDVGSESTATVTATEKNNHGEDGEGKVSKKKKKKGQNGNNNLVEQERQVESPVDEGPQKNSVTPVIANNIRPRHPQEHAPPVYVMSYNMASTAPTTSYYAGSPMPNQYNYQEPERMVAPPSDLECYSRQPLDSFEMFSDENPNGCSIM